MRAVRIVTVLLATLVFAGAAEARVRPVSGPAPTDLKGFLLRADEPATDVFSRTPSFAWKPVRGAIRYEFQLSTSSVFREGGIVFSDEQLTAPTAVVRATLPWITGNPHSLYARVRAVLPKTLTPWSAPFGFNMRWSTLPAPLPTYPGLLRWSTVDGAQAYQVWFVDIPKIVTVNTNVIDQREFYSFHQGAPWMSSVKWRIRALRTDNGERLSGVPAVSYGPWSPVYTSVNPPFQVGPLQGLNTVSDVVSDGSPTAPAHRLMPGFVFAGNQGVGVAAAELYRVYVFTDRDCVNVVYRGAIVGSPAYAPRPYGPLALPKSSTALVSARTSYLPTGAEGGTFSYDGDTVTTSESLEAAAPTIGLPAAATAAGATAAGGAAPGSTTGSSGSSGSTSGSTSGSSAPAAPASGSAGSTAGAGTAGTVTLLKFTGKPGAPVDLWDTDWPRGGYYWTVVPVEARARGAKSTSVAASGASAATQLTVASVSDLAAGDALTIGSGASQETATIVSITGSTITLAAGLGYAHGIGETVTRASGSIEYRDLELPQDVCASGRFRRFGKESEPALTGSGSPYASGLSPKGRLFTASAGAATFYGTPLVAWTPALGAAVYEVQWSKTQYPFRAEGDPRTKARGILTPNTSTVLPVGPGTWYYRVRGYNYSLPTSAQQMSWSQPARLKVTKPTFAVVKP